MNKRYIVLTAFLGLQVFSLFASGMDAHTKDLINICKNRVEMQVKADKTLSKNNQLKINYYCFVNLLSSGKSCKVNVIRDMDAAKGNKSKISVAQKMYQDCTKKNIMVASKDIESYIKKIQNKKFNDANKMMEKLIVKNKIDKKKLPFSLK